MNWITIATTILQLLPAIITAIKAIEDAIPGQGRGEDKLAAIRGILEVDNANVDAYWPALEKAIGVIVGLFNRTGVFAK